MKSKACECWRRRGLATVLACLWLLLGNAPGWAHGQFGSLQPSDRAQPREASATGSMDSGIRPGERPNAEAVRTVMWQAGRLLLAGLPAVRSAERSLQSERAQATLRENLAQGGPHAAFWRAEITRLLQQPDPGQDEIWSASARALGRIGNYEFVSLIAIGLDEANFPGRAEAARESIHLLFGVWLKSGSELAPYLDASDLDAGPHLLLKRALENERLATERLLKLFALRPAMAIDWLTDQDPSVRIEAARSLGAALNDASLDEATRAPWLEALFGRLELEQDPRAVHALLSALSQYTETQSLDAPAVTRLREALIGKRAGVNSMARAQAMARLPWRLVGELGDDHIYRAVTDLGGLIRSLAESDRLRGSPDPDPMIEVLVALQILCGRAESAGGGEGLRALEVRGDLLALISSRRFSGVVRVAACSAFGAFMLPADWPVLRDVVTEEDGLPALRYGALGLLHSLLLKLDASSAELAPLIALMVAQSGDADPDVRRKSLDVLGDPVLGEVIGSLDPSFLVRRFVAEDVSDLSLRVIGLIERFGQPAILAECMSSERFEQLASDAGSLPALSRMCASLVRGDGAAAMDAARHLAGPSNKEFSLGRLKQALELVASLELATAEALAGVEQRQICAWAWELHVLGVDLGTALRPAFLDRLTSIHWKRSAQDIDQSQVAYLFDEPASNHLLAVLLGMEALALPDSDPAAAPAIEVAVKAFERATKLAPDHLGTALGANLELEVRRDRARFLYAANLWPAALEQFRKLVAAGVLALPDLRDALEIMAALDDGTQSDLGASFFQLQRSAILHPTWPAEPLALRMQDLRDLSRIAMQDAGGPNSVQFVEMLRGLPEPALAAVGTEAGESAEPAPAVEETAPEPDQPAAEPAADAAAESDTSPGASAPKVSKRWADLVLDPERLAELRELRLKHEEAIARRVASQQEASDSATSNADSEGPKTPAEVPVEKKER